MREESLESAISKLAKSKAYQRRQEIAQALKTALDPFWRLKGCDEFLGDEVKAIVAAYFAGNTASAHLSHDGVSVAEICDKHFDRLIDTWVRLDEEIGLAHEESGVQL